MGSEPRNNAETFDSYAGTAYDDAVASAIRFSGQGHGFFLEAKVRWLLELVSRRVGDPADLELLDFGCGVGLMDGLLVPNVKRLHGVDVSAAAIEVAARANPDVSYTSYEGGGLPYEAGSFDVSFAVCVLHHVSPENRPQVVSEMARVTRNGGLVVVFEHNPLNPLTRLVVSRIPFDDDAILLGTREAAALLAAAGLVGPERRYILIAPWRLALLEPVERFLGPVPLGAQYYVAAAKHV